MNTLVKKNVCKANSKEFNSNNYKRKRQVKELQ